MTTGLSSQRFKRTWGAYCEARRALRLPNHPDDVTGQTLGDALVQVRRMEACILAMSDELHRESVRQRREQESG